MESLGNKPSEIVTKQNNTGTKVLTGLLILAVLGAGILAYLLIRDNGRVVQLTNDKAALSQENAQLKANPTIEGGKDFVTQSDICSQALRSVEAFMSTSGVTRMPTECRIGYLDNDYARVSVDYMVDDPTNGKNKPSGKGEGFYFKRVKGSDGTDAWAMIAINPMTADEVTSIKNRYGVPDKVFTEDKPA